MTKSLACIQACVHGATGNATSKSAKTKKHTIEGGERHTGM